MKVALRAAITPVPRRSVAAAALPLLDTGGAEVSLGCPVAHDAPAAPVVPSESSMFGPRGACVDAGGALWVADTGHHRLLGWKVLPGQSGEPAQLLLGQPGFKHEGRNAKSALSAITLNVPTGVAACGRALAVADAWNHRVLIWNTSPRSSNQPADVVLGQADFSTGESNRGAGVPAADTLHWPYGVGWDGSRLWVADTGNRRVLMWDGLPQRNGQAADLVLGQDSFVCRDENGGRAPDARGMRWPHGIAFLHGRLCVSDAGNNRVMIWTATPGTPGQRCDLIIGQSDVSRVDHNQGDYWPNAAALNMPYAVTSTGAWLVAADTANSRLVGWHVADLGASGATARRLTGQHDWESKGDNRWLPATSDSLCWPYGLSSHGSYAIIADAGNNRVLLWRWVREVSA